METEELEIAIDDIVIGKRLSKPSTKDIADVAGSMQTEGQLQAIGVNKVGDKYELVFGYTRVQAAKKLGWKTIRARAWSDLEGDSALAMEIAENIKRRKLTKLQELQQLAEYDAIFGRKNLKRTAGRPKKGDNVNPKPQMSQKQRAESMGKSISLYKKDMAAARALRKGTQDVLKGSIYEDATKLLYALARIDNPKAQQQTAAKLLEQPEMPFMEAVAWVEDQREVLNLLDQMDADVAKELMFSAPVKSLTEGILREVNRIEDPRAQLDAIKQLHEPGEILEPDDAIEVLWAARKEYEERMGIRHCEIINEHFAGWMRDEMEPASIDIIMTSATREGDVRIWRDLALMAKDGLADDGLLICFMETRHFTDAFKILTRSLHLVGMAAVGWEEPNNGEMWTPIGFWAKSEDVEAPHIGVLTEKNRAYDAMLRVANDVLRPMVEPGMLVVDPMCRRGAIPIVAYGLGAHAIGLEEDEGDATYATRNVDNQS